MTFGAAGFSVLIYLPLWDGKFQALPDQGGVGILISLGISIILGGNKGVQVQTGPKNE